MNPLSNNEASHKLAMAEARMNSMGDFWSAQVQATDKIELKCLYLGWTQGIRECARMLAEARAEIAGDRK